MVWFMVSPEVAVRMWPGLQSSEGLTELDDLLPRWCTHKAVIEDLSFSPCGPFYRLLKSPHAMAANFPQSKLLERVLKEETSTPFVTWSPRPRPVISTLFCF